MSILNQVVVFENPPQHMDLNVRVIKAVECCPLLYKEQASIERRQVVWQQLSEQMLVPETILKSRWHYLCSCYQRYLEKKRSTDENDDNATNNSRNTFKYEKEMAFMMPYVHARIAIAAANAARKQQEMAAAGTQELPEPEFVITEKDLERAARLNNNTSDEYVFYDVETLDSDSDSADIVQARLTFQQHQQQRHQQQHLTYHQQQHDGDEIIDNLGSIEQQLEMLDGLPEEEDVCRADEDADENNGIDIIIERGEFIPEDAEQIVVEEEEVLQMDDQIEVQNETIIEEMNDDEPSLMQAMTSPRHKVSAAAITALNMFEGRALRVASDASGHKFVKIVQDTSRQRLQQQPQWQQQQTSTSATLSSSSTSFASEYALMTRPRRAVVLKATPKVQVELTDNSAAVAVSVVDFSNENAAAAATSNVVAITRHEEDVEGAALDVAANAVVVDSGAEDSSSLRQRQQHQQQQQQQQHEVIEEAHLSAQGNKNGNGYQSNNNKNKNNLNIGNIGHHNNIEEDCDNDGDADGDIANATEDTGDSNDNQEYEHNSKRDRSEDTIFGELVTAMIKQMPKERKRSMKKRIMDMLLT